LVFSKNSSQLTAQDWKAKATVNVLQAAYLYSSLDIVELLIASGASTSLVTLLLNTSKEKVLYLAIQGAKVPPNMNYFPIKG
jgi:hypothetical protein